MKVLHFLTILLFLKKNGDIRTMHITPYLQDLLPNSTFPQDAGFAVEISVAVLLDVCVSTNSVCGKSASTEAHCIEQLKPGRDGMECGFENETPSTKY